MGASKRWDMTWVTLGWVGECIKCWPVMGFTLKFGSRGP